MTTSTTIDVRRAGDRFRTRLPWLESDHYADVHFVQMWVLPDTEAGDAVGLTVAGAPLLTAGAEGAEILLWELGR